MKGQNVAESGPGHKYVDLQTLTGNELLLISKDLFMEVPISAQNSSFFIKL